MVTGEKTRRRLPEYSRRLLLALEEYGIGTDQAAVLIGVSRRMVQLYLAGKKRPSRPRAILIAQRLNLPSAVFLAACGYQTFKCKETYHNVKRL